MNKKMSRKQRSMFEDSRVIWEQKPAEATMDNIYSSLEASRFLGSSSHELERSSWTPCSCHSHFYWYSALTCEHDLMRLVWQTWLSAIGSSEQKYWRNVENSSFDSSLLGAVATVQGKTMSSDQQRVHGQISDEEANSTCLCKQMIGPVTSSYPKRMRHQCNPVQNLKDTVNKLSCKYHLGAQRILF